MQFEFVIPGRLPGLNEYIAAMNRNRHIGNQLKKSTQMLIKSSVANGKPRKAFMCPVTITYRWFEKNRRRDKSNVSAFGRKCIEDALQEMYILRNDNWECITGYTDEFYIDQQNPRIEVIIDDGRTG